MPAAVLQCLRQYCFLAVENKGIVRSVVKRTINSSTMITMKDRKALYPVKFLESEVVSPDTKIFRFALETPEHTFGHAVGQNVHFIVKTGGGYLVRHYDIVSPPEKKGSFDVLVKIYRQNPKFPNGGKMSQYLEAMVPGGVLEVKGPSGPLSYEGQGLFAIKAGKQQPKMPFVAEQLGLIAGGSGIASMLQIMRTIFNNDDDKTKVFLLYSNKTEGDILLKSELNNMVKKKPNQFKIWYTLSRSAPDGWAYSQGHITTDMIRDHLPAAGANVLIMVCGPDAMIQNACLPGLSALGHDQKNIVVCD